MLKEHSKLELNLLYEVYSLCTMYIHQYKLESEKQYLVHSRYSNNIKKYTFKDMSKGLYMNLETSV